MDASMTSHSSPSSSMKVRREISHRRAVLSRRVQRPVVVQTADERSRFNGIFSAFSSHTRGALALARACLQKPTLHIHSCARLRFAVSSRRIDVDDVNMSIPDLRFAADSLQRQRGFNRVSLSLLLSPSLSHAFSQSLHLSASLFLRSFSRRKARSHQTSLKRKRLHRAPLSLSASLPHRQRDSLTAPL